MRVFNLLIAGIGGQGVVTLTKILTDLAEADGRKTLSSIFKGGAQRLGTVHSIIRFFEQTEDYSNFSLQIPKGKLDLLIGFEPWEAMRHSSLCSNKTSLVVNSRLVPMRTDSFRNFEEQDPCLLLMNLGSPLILRDFDSKRAMNFELGLAAIQAGYLPLDQRRYESLCLKYSDSKKGSTHDSDPR